MEILVAHAIPACAEKVVLNQDVPVDALVAFKERRKAETLFLSF